MSHKKIHFKYLTLLIIVDLFGFLFAGCTEEGQSGNSETNSPVVDTQFGQVEAIEDVNSTWVWKAIPFAKPPVNNLRWKAPQDPDPWEEVRKETEFGSDCIQNANTPRGDEDCLYLNVWRPQNDDTKRPVFLYIHGGGNNVGSTNSSDIYGANLADAEDMVVVTSNYRLGPLGWFAHSSLRTGDSGNEYDDSGNFGTLDLVKALNWISKNIEAFGGDPENVTIAGQSAGCHNVLSLLISPEAENIFHRAIAGSALYLVTNTMETGETHVNDIILKLLVNDGSAANQTEAESILNTKTDTEIEDYLRAKDGYEILSAYDGNPFTGMIEFPYFFQDGTVIPEAGLDVFDTGAYNKVPVIIGNTKEETKMFMFGRPDLLSLDDAIYQIIATYDSDMIKAAGVDTFARKLESHTDQPAVYAYQFQWGQWKGEVEKSVIPEPNGSKIGACHGMDVSFFMGNDTFYGSEELTSWVFNEENRISRKALSSAILAYVAQFARTGNPNGSDVDLPEWEQWSNDEGQPKSILLDADLSGTLDIRMSDVELTNQGIKDDLCSKRTEEFYSDAYNFLISDAYDFMGYDTYDFIGWECNE